jgi:acetyltransferase-like isoleucine patch superfamily enzyme
VRINAPLKRGMIQIGFGEVYTFDQHRSRTMWCVDGTVIFEGSAHIGHGSKIHVGGDLTIGKDFVMTAESQITCNHKITFGSGVLVSWECLFMDNDFHKIMVDRKVVNHPRPISIGNHVWFGCRCTVLKGAEIGDNVVVAATSTVTARHNQPNTVIGGSPVRVLKESVEWEA